MSQQNHYNHQNVPEEIAKKFPALQGKHFGHIDVPQHVLESVKRNVTKPLVQSRTLQPLIQQSFIGQPAVLGGGQPVILPRGVAQNQFTNTGFLHQGNSKVYTDLDVPEDVAKKFPNLQQRIHKNN
ncbi:hypothetical protein IMG5_081340 [Ichthyophthirius multifiliis]|uniref:Uncharacterized protein n=1 Tax=Ichthyophthirius multifiliis TaxID=5932 RepID=G0QQM4_ICHMU|nr:hypothetical protein IMG5_081340 [Ichthyophthirius multifiliis]EGR32476.1 hypothetical protein IMG5_081340 [Ichthyophthirius multifiliis]|eukprot:XP_004036462.1 hypothetical protein IMG5_081340 [Ichthyophthirius multifiliis]